MKLKIKFESLKGDTDEVCKFLLFNKAGEILLLKRALHLDRHPGEWDFPGGHSKKGEKLQQAAVRECVEETSITPMGVKKLFSDDAHHIFYGKHDASEPNLSSEHTSFQTLSPKNIIQKKVLTKRYEDFVKKYLKEFNND